MAGPRDWARGRRVSPWRPGPHSVALIFEVRQQRQYGHDEEFYRHVTFRIRAELRAKL